MLKPVTDAEAPHRACDTTFPRQGRPWLLSGRLCATDRVDYRYRRSGRAVAYSGQAFGVDRGVWYWGLAGSCY